MHPFEHDPQLQPRHKPTSPNRSEQSCVALLNSSMFAVEAPIHSETLECLSEIERTPAAYALQRYQKLGVPFESVGEMAYTAAKRAKNISVKKFQLQHPEFGVPQMWFSTYVV